MDIPFLAVLCLLLGLLLALPFARWRRRRRLCVEPSAPGTRFTPSGLLFILAVLSLFFGGLGVRAVAPDSVFAGWIGGDLGALRWGIGVFVASSWAEMVLRRAGVSLMEDSPQQVRPRAGETTAPSAPAARRRVWKIATLGGVAILVRGSLPTTGLLVACVADSGWLGTIAYGAAFVALILVHELGHVVAARAQGLRVFAVVLSGAGGRCHTQVPRGVRDTFVLFAGGLIAQMALLALTLAAVAVLGPPREPGWRALVVTFTVVNLVIAAINLVPGKFGDDLSNDGAILWDLALHVAGRKPHPLAAQHAASPVFDPATNLVALDGMVPAGFEVGVEILNDDATPMEFVAAILEQDLGLARDAALAAMLRIHTQGGQLFPLPDRARAEQVAAGVMRKARAGGHPLQCRAVSMRG